MPATVARSPLVLAHPRGSGPAIGAGRDAGRALGDAWHWRGLRSGLGRKLDSGWMAALNYTRAAGAGANAERMANGAPRAGNSPPISNVARRAFVLTLTRNF
jgi:hypothetical protein